MKKLLTILVASALFLLAVPVLAQTPPLAVPQGGTGTSTIPSGWFVTGSSALRLTAKQFISLLTDVSGTLSVLNGGTGLGSTPSVGQVLVGNGAGYTLMATSSLGLQPQGNYLTALTGDGTASGPGSAALTLATVNGNVGSFGSSISIPSFTVDGKGRITAASGNAVIAPAGTLTGTTLASGVTSSSLTSLNSSLTGIIKASSGALSAAVNGTDYTLITAKTCAGSDFVSAVTAAGVFTCTTPSGGGSGGGLGTTSPWTNGNLAYVTGPSSVGSVATGTLATNATGLQFDNARALVGGSATLSLSSGYGIPTTASTTAWNTFYDTPSTRITAGTGLSWSGNTLNNTGVLSIGGLTGTVATSSLGLQSPITLTTTGSGAATFIANVLNIPTPVAGVSTTTSNTWAGTQTFTNAPIFSSLTGLLKGNGASAITVATAGTDYEVPLTFSSPLVRSTNTISIPAATGSVNGYLTSADWTTFNGKQASGNYLTALTGDGTASGPGSAALTLATVNGNVGTFGSATQAPQFTANAKGLITAIANVTITPAIGSITGLGTGVATALGINTGSAGAFVVNGGALGTPSSGTITNATGLPIVGGTTGTLTETRGGTNQTTYTKGDLLAATASNTLGKLAVGSNGTVLTASSTAATGVTWTTPSGGTIAYQAFTSGTTTWTKPSGLTGNEIVKIQIWSGGGGGGGSTGGSNNKAGGGSGGSYMEFNVLASSLGSTVSVTVGAGGTAGTTSTGGGGGTSSFGSLGSMPGGGGGIGGLGTNRAGVQGAHAWPTTFPGTAPAGWLGGAAAGSNGSGGASVYGGGGSAGSNGNGNLGGPSIYGGGGGGGATDGIISSGGVSQQGGSGGAGGWPSSGVAGTAGNAPAGGGGGGYDANGGAGGRGEVRVWVIAN